MSLTRKINGSVLSGISRGKETAALLHKKIGVKIFDFNFFYGKADLEKFHARQAFHALTKYFSITKRGLSQEEIFFLRQLRFYQSSVFSCSPILPISV